MDYVRKTDVPEGYVNATCRIYADEAIYTCRDLVPQLGITQGMKVLDVGCANGRDLAQIISLGLDVSCTGIDSCQVALDNAAVIHPGPAYVCADARSLPFPDQSFDLAFCNAFFTELTDADVQIVLSEMKRVAKSVVYTEMRISDNLFEVHRV